MATIIKVQGAVRVGGRAEGRMYLESEIEGFDRGAQLSLDVVLKFVFEELAEVVVHGRVL